MRCRWGKVKENISKTQYLKRVKFKNYKKMKTNNQFTSKFINQNFRIKVFGYTEDGKKINTLMGVSGIIAMIGEELFFKFVQRALDSMKDVCVCKLRRGLQVSLYVK